MSKNARYFIMKSSDLKSIEVSIEQGVWSTTYGPTKKLADAFKHCGGKGSGSQAIYLIFSVNESGGFQGLAKLLGPPSSTLKPHIFKQQPGSIHYEDNFPVQWMTKLMLYPFRNLNMFPLNPLNDNSTIM